MARMGRPKLFDNCIDFDALVELYFEDCDENDIPYTITGIAIALEMDRRSIVNYSREQDFFPTIKRARLRVENRLEQRLDAGAPTGTIFNLKNNFGWKDSIENVHTGPSGGPIPVADCSTEEASQFYKSLMSEGKE